MVKLYQNGMELQLPKMWTFALVASVVMWTYLLGLSVLCFGVLNSLAACCTGRFLLSVNTKLVLCRVLASGWFCKSDVSLKLPFFDISLPLVVNGYDEIFFLQEMNPISSWLYILVFWYICQKNCQRNFLFFCSFKKYLPFSILGLLFLSAKWCVAAIYQALFCKPIDWLPAPWGT